MKIKKIHLPASVIIHKGKKDAKNKTFVKRGDSKFRTAFTDYVEYHLEDEIISIYDSISAKISFTSQSIYRALKVYHSIHRFPFSGGA